MAKAKDVAWTGAELTLEAPAAATGLPDTAAFMAWYNPRYTKLRLIDGADTLNALFDMPQGMKLRLAYGKETIARWRQGDTMQVKVMFNVGKWASFLGPKGWSRRQDGRGKPYALFSETENPVAWTSLKNGLTGSFMADTVSMR
jgi:hypothetical protein